MSPRIACVGTATLDIVYRVDAYPVEDSEVRASAQTRRMGGNAANTAIVLAQLGCRTSWVGNLPSSSDIIDHSFHRHGVDASRAIRVNGAVMPTSTILLSAASGTRSIVHFRDMPEYQAAHFAQLDLGPYDWVHFEGRAVDQLAPMMHRARSQPGLTISLEIEKPRADIEHLFPLADLLLFSHDYAHARGFGDAQSLLVDLPGGIPATCTWGGDGAWSVDPEGQLQHAGVPQLPKVVDTIGAGDVFNAAMVHAVSDGQLMRQALQAAVSLASAQCAHFGLVLPERH